MKKKHLFLAATAIFIASCSDNSYLGDQAAIGEGVGGPISFNYDVPAVTRAGGSAAATALGNRFIVYGEKGDITTAAPTTGNLVFPNYQVNFVENTANTTTSNTKDWEYVGYTHSNNYQSNITRKASSSADAVNASNAVQTIKYWDYNANNYVFTAVSALDADIESGRVKIQKNEYGDDAYKKGYTITLAKSGSAPYVYPTLNKLYFSDRQVITKGTGKDRTAMNAYGGNVTLTFRNLVSHVRAGVYETIPGYAVTAIKFYVDNGSGVQDTEAKVSSTSAFGAICPNTKISNYEGTITVNYYTNTDGTAIENQPKVTHSVAATTNLILGTNMSTISSGGTPLGTTASSPTWDTSAGAFTEVLPQIENSSNLKLKVDYTLWNSVSGETINISGKTAEVPSEYLKWKPNYKYSYIFKITDDDLYPITFDAVEIVAEDGKAEYITTVTQPSITTFGVKDGKYTTGTDEYKSGTTIYATCVKEDGTVFNPSLGSDTHIFRVTSTDYTDFPVTEASVAESQQNPSGSNKIQVIHECCGYNSAEKVTSVPAEDGTTKTINAIKFTPTTTSETKYYALRYTTTTPVVSGYSAGTVLAEGTSLEGYYKDKYTKCGENAKAEDGKTYYKLTEYVEVTGLTDGSSVANYFTKSGVVYNACGENDTYSSTTTYYRKVSDYYTQVTETLIVGTSDVSDYYTMDAEKVACGDSEPANGVPTYYLPTYSTAPGYTYKVIKIVP